MQFLNVIPLLLVLLVLLTAAQLASSSVPVPVVNEVNVYHFIIPHWGLYREGDQNCGPDLKCVWLPSDNIGKLKQGVANHRIDVAKRSREPESAQFKVNNSVSLSLYNIHSLWEKKREHHPPVCELQTNMTMAESEESAIRYGHLFNPSFKNFDAHSTTSPSSHVQRIYEEAFLNFTDPDMVVQPKNFSTLVKGASYVASDCHNRDSANANRDAIVMEMRGAGLRVDGLGRCLRTPTGPEGITLPKTRDTRYNLKLKREAISKYMFNMAFENSIEAGYVTEKPFDALVSSTVPIYLGDSKHLKSLLPHPKAAIFLTDYGGNMTRLIDYLDYLMTNEAAYEEHRAWRKDYSPAEHSRVSPFLESSWSCRVCQWALDNAHVHQKRIRKCKDEKNGQDSYEIIDASSFNGKAIRASGREVYYVIDDTIHTVPDLNTLFSLNISLASIQQVGEREFKGMKIGDAWPKATKEYEEIVRVRKKLRG